MMHRPSTQRIDLNAGLASAYLARRGWQERREGMSFLWYKPPSSRGYSFTAALEQEIKQEVER